MLMLGVFVLLPLPLIVPSLGLPFFASSLVFMLLYLWSRENPNANTSIMGLVTLKAFCLPWGMMGATAMMGGSIVPDLLGVVAPFVDLADVGRFAVASRDVDAASRHDDDARATRGGSARGVSRDECARSRDTDGGEHSTRDRVR